MINSSLHYEVHLNHSAHEWVVFIHGAGGNTSTWKYQVESFKPLYNLLIIDLRDHGRSKNIMPEKDNYTFDIITDDIKKVLDINGIEKAHFVTLSFGSVIMQDISIKYPNMVASAIFAGGIFKANLLIKSFVQLARFFNLFLSYFVMYSVFSYLLMPYRKHQKSRKIYQKQANKLSSKEYMKWVGLYNEFFRLLNRFYNQKINFPALAIMGKQDYVFLKSAQKFAKKHKNVIITEVKGAGHICNIDQYDIFNELALYFIHEHKYQIEDTRPDFQAQRSKAG
ncbi:alpha/beta fold hydrolase [Marivirga arenosa]|uniref:Alpha/beta hydrolase n=1 Tax=Marivirga arenosa TaxID=3059076 RepID=A0AA51X4S0_9BACT|nr:alpha/beta hydrolase [Marivirga sp. BKB1-2]WNB16981.1 alpha/beta hydrolase [Marivirga sp. BKB1-2]